MGGLAGTMMPETVVERFHCNAHGTGWLNGAHPTIEGNLSRGIDNYRHSLISAVSISAIFDLPWFIILFYFPPL